MPERERRPTPERERRPDPEPPDRDDHDPIDDADDVIDEVEQDEDRHEPDRQ